MTIAVGHNGGPSMGPVSWRSHCWRQARRQLLPVLPVEVVRLRVRRAQALGLDYKTYAGVRASTGRDLIAFLFSSNALAVFRDAQPVTETFQNKLGALNADRHLGVSPGLDADLLAAQIGAVSAQKLPAFGAKWSEMRRDMKSWLKQQNLPGDAVLMIGETDHEREIMQAGGLAGFVSGHRYFTGEHHAI